MRLKGIVLTVVNVFALAFVVINWQAIMTPLPINLLFITMQVPLGFILVLTAIGLSILFFIMAFFDRFGQLNQIVSLERELAKMRKQVEAQRSEELSGMELKLGEQLSGVEDRVADTVSKLEASMRESIANFETHTDEHLDKLEERVLLVRNELAADIAEAEDALRRNVKAS